MPRYDDNFLDELTRRADIVEVASRYVQLRRTGQNHVGLCPFHNEKTPSFTLSQDKQIFKCFGCGAAGGVIQFVMRIENYDFSEAVEHLANLYHLPVAEDENGKAQRRIRERLYELNRAAAVFYHGCLGSVQGEKAREYLQKRRLSESTVKSFGLGYAPDAWDALISAMAKQGYEKHELLQAGLARRSERGGIYDAFRDKLMFPIIDVKGNVVAFGGRVLDNSLPKYINTSDTPVFDKRRNLYALNYAKKTQGRRLLICEGYMDVITLHQAGFQFAVASLGTAFTQEQAQLITRYADEVILVYDADEAGQRATKRASDILAATGINTKILRIPGEKDPDDYIKTYGAKNFEALLEGGKKPVEYMLEDIRAKYRLEDDAQRVEYAAEAARQLAGVENALEREVYAGRVAETARIDRKTLLLEIEKHVRKKTRADRREQHSRDLSPARRVQPPLRSLRYANPTSAVCEEGVIQLISTHSELLEQIETKISGERFSSDKLARIFIIISEMIKNGRSITLATVMQELSAEESELYAHIMAKEIRFDAPEQAAAELCDTIYRQSLLKKDEQNGREALLEMWKMKKKTEDTQDE